MSLTSLRLMNQHHASEERAIDRAINAVKLSDMPSYAQMGIISVGFDSAKKLVVNGGFDDGPFGNATVTFDGLNGKATVDAYYFIVNTGGSLEGNVPKGKQRTLLRNVKKQIDAGKIAASLAVRQEVDRLLDA